MARKQTPKTSPSTPPVVLGKHPCGRRQVIAKQGSKRFGYRKGDIKPCRCVLCGPVEFRQNRWDWWGSYRYAGFYSCHKCRQVRYTRGEAQETMWCRDCYLLPPKGWNHDFDAGR